MIFKTEILDMNRKEWTLECDVLGEGFYDDDGNRSGLVVKDLRLVDIVMERPGIKMKIESLAFMPDQFSQLEVNEVERNAELAFLEDWMDVQDCAHDLIVDQD